MRKYFSLKKFITSQVWLGFSTLSILVCFFWLMGFAYPAYRSLYLSSDSVKQGNTLAVNITGIRPGSKFSCTYGGKEIPLYENDSHTLTGLIAVSACDEPCTDSLQIAYKNLWRELMHKSIDFMILEQSFKRERIRLPRKKGKLYKNTRVPEERNKISGVYQTETPAKLWGGSFIWPVKRRVTSPFGARRIYTLGKETSGYHRGIDISAPTGTKIHAGNTGVVLMANHMVLSGYTVILDHGQGVLSIYKHLSRVSVEAGQAVAKGDLLGLSGSTGLSTGPHLHWEMRVHAVPVNPIEWIEKEF